MIYLGVYRTEEDHDLDLIEVQEFETACIIMRMALIGKVEDLPPIPDFLVDDAMATLVAYADIINCALGRPQFTIHLNQQAIFGINGVVS